MRNSVPGSQTRNHPAAARVGAGLGGISIAFSTLCFLVMPAFTPAFILAALFGSLSGAIALALRARRTALVAFAFALAPFPGFLLMQYAAEPLRNGYVVLLPLALATASAIWSLLDYSRTTRRPAPIDRQTSAE